MNFNMTNYELSSKIALCVVNGRIDEHVYTGLGLEAEEEYEDRIVLYGNKPEDLNTFLNHLQALDEAGWPPSGWIGYDYFNLEVEPLVKIKLDFVEQQKEDLAWLEQKRAEYAANNK